MAHHKKQRYFNDPIYGILEFPFPIIEELIDHPYLQRLRRITQCGLSHYVYPGANHTRFHHTLGVTHLMTRALNSLRKKNIDINDKECEAACICALIHDVGHSPYSHALEQRIVPFHHEEISLLIAQELNLLFDGRLEVAIEILKGNHPKQFLSQLISGQIDVDRLDYLARDSFYTGVAEGMIGYERIIQTINVKEGRLVIDEKGIHSIEKFLVSRHLMYLQVYMHKTVLALEQMLILLTDRIRYLLNNEIPVTLSKPLNTLLRMGENEFAGSNFLKTYLQLDDYDLMYVIKNGITHHDFVFAHLCDCLLNRKIFHIDWINSLEKRYLFNSKRLELQRSLGVSNDESAFLMRSGEESSTSYLFDDEIEILTTQNFVVPFSTLSSISFSHQNFIREFICYPRLDQLPEV